MKKKYKAKLKLQAWRFIFPAFLWIIGITIAHATTASEVVASNPAALKQTTVNGTVVDNTGDPLPGATVVIKGTTTGTITDVNGKYSLSVAPNAVLVFSYIGYKTTELSTSGNTTINVILEVDENILEQVVVVGYGTQKKVNLTGAVGVATSERLENRPITSVGTGLQGVIPNLNISIESGDPSKRAKYNIRGYESINEGNPLILVDGIPMDLDLINPSDIKSVSVLKDASASAVYGARAAFGVILVETKKGRKGLQVNLSSEYALSKPIFHTDQITDGYEYAMRVNQVVQENIGQDFISQDRVAKLKIYHDNPTKENEWGWDNNTLEFYGNTDFAKLMIADFSPQQKHDVSISGATDKSSYYVSFGYMNKKGILKNDRGNQNYSRYNILMKTDFQLAKWINVDSKISINSEIDNQPHFYGNDRSLNTVVRFTPNNPILFPDLPYYREPGDHDEWAPYIGMYWDAARMAPYVDLGGRDLNDSYSTMFTQGITLTPLKGLRIRADYSHQIFYQMREEQASKVPTIKDGKLNDFQITYSQSGNDYMQNTTNYDHYNVLNTFAEYTWEENEDHFVKVMAGFNQEWGSDQMFLAKAMTLAYPTIRNIGATLGDQSTNGSNGEVALRGAFYRLNSG